MCAAEPQLWTGSEPPSSFRKLRPQRAVRIVLQIWPPPCSPLPVLHSVQPHPRRLQGQLCALSSSPDQLLSVKFSSVPSPRSAPLIVHGLFQPSILLWLSVAGQLSDRMHSVLTVCCGDCHRERQKHMRIWQRGRVCRSMGRGTLALTRCCPLDAASGVGLPSPWGGS